MVEISQTVYHLYMLTQFCYSMDMFIAWWRKNTITWEIFFSDADIILIQNNIWGFYLTALQKTQSKCQYEGSRHPIGGEIVRRINLSKGSLLLLYLPCPLSLLVQWNGNFKLAREHMWGEYLLEPGYFLCSAVGPALFSETY